MTKKAHIPNQSLQIPKVIIQTAKLLQAISPKLVTLFAAKLFTTPIKHAIPKRELQMDKNSTQQKILLPVIKKNYCLSLWRRKKESFIGTWLVWTWYTIGQNSR